MHEVCGKNVIEPLALEIDEWPDVWPDVVAPSVGATIAAALGISKRKNGYIAGTDHIVSWCIGHLVGLANAGSYEERYKKWSYEDLPILPDPFCFVLSPDKEEQFAVLKGLTFSVLE